MAAALPGVIAASTTLPVIGVPVKGSVLDGMDAVYSWRMMDKKQADNEEELKQRLSEYCGMDTYSMVVLYKWLRAHAQEEEHETC